jgi:hypothetical protein
MRRSAFVLLTLVLLGSTSASRARDNNDEVLFWNGVCRTETYQKSPPTAFLESEISALLRDSAGRSKWEPVPSVSGPVVLWRGPDKRIALHDTARHMLHISKEEYVIQKTIYR